MPLEEVTSEYELLRMVIQERFEKASGAALPDVFRATFDEAVTETHELYRRARAQGLADDPRP
jgi:hypothetical protein